MRPIDADALKNKLMELPGGYAQSFAGKACLMAIDDAQTLDYAPVKRGEWAAVRNADGMMCGVKCSWCGRRVRNTGENYCPRCGAQMEEGWVVDCEQSMKVCIENNGVLESEVSGDQASLVGMLSEKMFNSDVSCVEARAGEVLYVWLEDAKDENA